MDLVNQQMMSNVTARPSAPQRELPRGLDRPGHGPVVVVGGPGTGRTTLAVDVLRSRLDRGTPAQRLLFLVPTRQAADRLRDELAMTAGVTFSEPVVRTYSAYAFDVIRRARQSGDLLASTRAPRLLSGAEQDAFVAELLRGHRQRGGGPAWPAELGEAVSTRGFRKEVREFLDRASELGLDADDVAELGRRCGVAEWVAAADFLREYRQVGLLDHEEAYDPAELVSIAVSLLSGSAGEHVARAELDRHDLVVVDDLQEATGSQHRMVRLLARDRDAVLTASPDTVVQGFRGARPDLVRHVGEGLASGRDAPVVELEHNHRLAGSISDAVARVARRIPASTGDLGRRWEPDENEDPTEVDVRLVESPVHRDRLISRHVLQAHLFDAVPLGEIAVIVRNGGQVRQTARALGLDGISTTVPPVEIPLRDESAVRPLVEILRRALAMAEAPAPVLPVARGHREAAAEAASVQALLTGPYGRATTLDVRSLRQALLILERGRGGERNSTDLLAALLDGEFTEADLTGLGPVALPAKRLVAMLTAGVEHLKGRHTSGTALWAVWNASGAVSRTGPDPSAPRKHQDWREIALHAKGLRSDRANRDLDAVLALFQAAERYEDQFPGAGVSRFLDHLQEQDLPMDSLAGTAAPGGRVHVLTPAAAAGRDFDTVIVAGLEEGAWPSTGLRGTLLRSDDLVTAVEHGAQAMSGVDVSTKLRGVREDEMRQFVTALSRARRRLHLVAVSSEESSPSSFLPLVQAPHTPDPVVAPVPLASTLAHLTSTLRRTLETRADATSADAAGLLAFLADQDPPVQGADPAQWWGLAPLSSEDPIVADGVAVRVSPSKVESVLESPLNWFVQAAGGVAPTDFARSLGTLVHGIAEEHPDADQEELLAALARRWDELQMPENWVGKSEHHRAETMLNKLAMYYAQVDSDGRRVAAREQPFSVAVDPVIPGEHPVRLTGSMDRVEITPNGKPLIVDLKTGKVLPTAGEIGEHPQLMTYQAAVLAGALDQAHLDGLTDPRTPEGAALVGVGRKAVKPTVLAQGAVAPEATEPWEMIAEAARGMSAATFDTTHEQGERVRCTHPGVCPLCEQGRQVTEP
jgi:superfamily I DNA/RNA helicase/RecB family exonuclease